MEMDFNMENPSQEIRLGLELLDMALKVSSNPTKLREYNEVLDMPGVDSALFMLYRASQEDSSHPRHLLQSAFMLGYYIYESLQEVNKLWQEGPVNDPS